MNQFEVVGVDFVSSFGGVQSYLIRTPAGSLRVDAHYPESDYHRSICCYKGADYDKYMVSKIGCYTGASEMLTLDVAVAFNRLRFEYFDNQVTTILGNKNRYGDFDPLATENLFTVFLPATFSEESGWTALFTYEEVRVLAGIPANRCTSIYKVNSTPHAGDQLAA